MPFTLSHPAAVLPFVKVASRHGATSALVIGSLVPDIPYFVPWSLAPFGTHSLLGLATFCVPFGLVAVLGFEFVCRAPLVALLPESWRPAIGGDRRPAPLPGMIAASVLALLLGASTHVLWDAVTDPGGSLLGRTTWLRLDLAIVGGYHVFVYRLLKHCGTIAGAGAIAWAAYQWYSRHTFPAARHDERRRLARVAAVCAVLVATSAYAAARANVDTEWLQAIRYFLYRTVIALGRSGSFVIGFYAAVWWARRGGLPFLTRGADSRGRPASAAMAE